MIKQYFRLAQGTCTFLLQEMAAKSDVQYVAGGATQNSIRAAQWMLQVPGATSYFGSVGDDAYADKLRDAAHSAGVNVCFQPHPPPSQICLPIGKISPRRVMRRRPGQTVCLAWLWQ